MDPVKKLKFDEIDTVLADSDHTYRQTIFDILRNIGLRKIRQMATLEEIRASLTDPAPDLVISEAELSDGDFCRLVHDLRNGDIGNNPFMVILTLSAEPTKKMVRRVIDSGSDDLLTKPISSTQMKSRITNLIEQRKPFVVTSDYIGPSRRDDSKIRSGSVPLVEVPNTLMEKASGIQDDKNSLEKIATTVRQINLQKLKRYAVQISYLVEHIIAALDAGDDDDLSRRQIRRLNFIAHDTARRLLGTGLDHIAELCKSLIKVTERITSNTGQPRKQDIELLPPLAAAIKAGFDSDMEETADLAHQISSELAD